MPCDFAATLPEPTATIGHQPRKRGSATLRNSSNSLPIARPVSQRALLCAQARDCCRSVSDFSRCRRSPSQDVAGTGEGCGPQQLVRSHRIRLLTTPSRPRRNRSPRAYHRTGAYPVERALPFPVERVKDPRVPVGWSPHGAWLQSQTRSRRKGPPHTAIDSSEPNSRTASTLSHPSRSQ